MLTVYGRATSSNVQAVMWTIAELGLEYERLDYGHKFGGNKTPEFLAMNPNGLVPVVVDGDAPFFIVIGDVVGFGEVEPGAAYWGHSIYQRV